MVSPSTPILDPKIRKQRQKIGTPTTPPSTITSPPITPTTPTSSASKIRKSSYDHHHDEDGSRPLKRASSVSYKISTPDTSNSSIFQTPSSNSRICSSTSTNSIGSLRSASSSSSTSFSSAAAKGFRKSRSVSSNLAGKIKNRVFKSPSFSNGRQNQVSAISTSTPSKLGSPVSIASASSCSLSNSLFSQVDFPLSPISPLQNIHEFTTPPNLKKNLLSDLQDCEDKVSQLSLLEPLPQNSTNFSKCSQIFEIPEILNIILFYVGHDDQARIPTEIAPVRRSHNRSTSTYSQLSKNGPNLYNCLFVNKLWHHLTLDVLKEHTYFDSDSKLINYYENKLTQQVKYPGSYKTNKSNTKSLVLHKLKSQVKQHHLDLIASTIDPLYLTWIELYICPKLIPTPSLLTASLQKLVVPGSRHVSDDFLVQVSFNCPNLKQLDIRACEMVTDAGIFAIGLRCPNLESLNCGRHQRGELISDVGISCIIQNTNINTLGVAGCGITNACIWEIGMYKGKTLQRLSLNNCWRLNDHGLPEVLREDYFHRLSVLEIRGCLGIKNFRPMVDFKKRQYARKISVLVEACQELDSRLAQAQAEADREISARIFSDISEWLDQEDSDRDFRELFRARGGNNINENYNDNDNNIVPALG